MDVIKKLKEENRKLEKFDSPLLELLPDYFELDEENQAKGDSLVFEHYDEGSLSRTDNKTTETSEGDSIASTNAKDTSGTRDLDLSNAGEISTNNEEKGDDGYRELDLDSLSVSLTSKDK